MPHPSTSSAYGIWSLNEIRDAVRGENWPSAFSLYPLTINQSLRFNNDDAAYLSRTPASAGNQRTWTFSAWVKRGNLTLGSTNHQTLFSCGTENTQVRFNAATDTLDVLFGGSTDGHLVTSQVFRDPSAWYHIVVEVDTTQVTSSNRCKIYINGEQVTAFGTETYPAQNYDTGFNNTEAHNIGRSAFDSNRWFDGYLAEVHFTDGTAYTADDFGQLQYGVWVAKTPAVTYGTNGFYLAFADSAAIGDDTSGNTNDWTPNNFAVSDVVADSPTNNFATFNATTPSLSSLSNGNLQYALSTVCAPATIGIATGKWYFEGLVASQNSAESSIGVINDLSATVTVGATANGWGILVQSNANNGQAYHAGGVTSSYATFTAGDIVMVAFDADAGKLWFGRNGTWFNSGDPAAGTGEIYSNLSGTIFPAFANRIGSGALQYANFGQDSTFAGNKTAGGNSDSNSVGDFAYAPPTDFLSVCTANLPAPAIDPAQQASPADYFNTVLYTGDGNDDRSITGVGFQPDFVWFKQRSAIRSHLLVDAIRGATQRLKSDTTGAEDNFADGCQAFESDGFQVGTNNTVNVSGGTYVTWNWKANGTGVANTDGTISSTVSTNTTSGFSIVSYTGNGSAGATVGHGLGVAPKLLIIKNRDASTNWRTYTTAVDGTMDSLFLNDTSAKVDSGSSLPTSTVFELGTNSDQNASGNDYVCYAFHSVEGFSKIGSYTGNGSADGPFVYTGFRPAFVMIKAVDNTVATTYQSWKIIDSTRYDYNAGIIPPALWANASYAEGARGNGSTASYIARNDLLSNGFKLGGPSSYEVETNQSGIQYIYMAFAESPFKYANAR